MNESQRFRKRPDDRPKPGLARRFDRAVNNWFDNHQIIWWWLVFVALCSAFTAIVFAILNLPTGVVTPKQVNIGGAALVAVGLAAQAADGLKDSTGGDHSRRRINAYGFLTAVLGASAVVAGQILS